MDEIVGESSSLEGSMRMNTEEHYRSQAAFYRCSAEYVEMKKLYPIIQTSIEECKDEPLVI